MLDDFNLEQKISYKTLKNSIDKYKISHAYIIESNGYSKSFDFALAFAKSLFCPNNYTKYDESFCGKCNQCKKIDNNEFIELKVIESEGMWIKKSQLDELQEIFSKKTIIGNKKVYIIKEADKLNESSSNSLLKFLEEPEDNIIAILIVNSIYQLINTIVSRCQVISLKSNDIFNKNTTLERISQVLTESELENKLYLEDINNSIKINKVIEFIKFYELNHLDIFSHIKELWNDNFNEKNDIYKAYTLMILFYKDVLNVLLGKNLEFYIDYTDDIKKISDINTKQVLIQKMNVIINLREKIRYNVNSNMLMDKLIIELEGSKVYE